jgi:hypothetical protein
MKSNNVFSLSSLRLALSATILLASNLGCAYFPGSTSVQPTLNSVSQYTSTTGLTSKQHQTLQNSPSSTIQSTATFPLKSTKETTVTPTIASPLPIQTMVPSEDLIWEMIGRVDIERALTDLRRLSGVDPICIDGECYTITDRETGSEGLGWAKDYVYQELVNLGYSVELREWSLEGWSDQNIIARKSGFLHPDEEIYFVAHLDGVASSPAADDDGSGAVDLLELARILNNYSFSRTLVLLFSTGEEHGSLGSRSYVDQLSQEEIISIKYVTSIDMVGYDSDSDGVMQLWPGDHPPSLVFAQTVNEIISTYQIDLAPRIITDCY